MSSRLRNLRLLAVTGECKRGHSDRMNPAFSAARQSGVDTARARLGLSVFIALLVIGCAYFKDNVAALSRIFGTHLVFMYMWWVAVASCGAHLLLQALHDSVTDGTSRWLTWPKARAVLVATALPLVVGVIAYGVAWSTHLARFTVKGLPAAAFAIPVAGSPAARLFKILLINITIVSLWRCA